MRLPITVLAFIAGTVGIFTAHIVVAPRSVFWAMVLDIPSVGVLLWSRHSWHRAPWVEEKT